MALARSLVLSRVRCRCVADAGVTAATRRTRGCDGDISRTGTEYACHSMSLGERAMGDKFKAGVELRVKRSNDAREHGLDQSWKKNVSLSFLSFQPTMLL